MSFDHLLEEVKKGFGVERIKAARDLGKTGDKRAVPALVDLLDDRRPGPYFDFYMGRKSPTVREKALDLLETLSAGAFDYERRTDLPLEERIARFRRWYKLNRGEFTPERFSRDDAPGNGAPVPDPRND